jgi:hypothetical protein
MGTVANINDWEAIPPAPASVKRAILGQESGDNPNAPTSIDGAVGKAQIEPDTFAQYAAPGERMDNAQDYDRVYNRIVDHLYSKAGGDPVRTAVGYFSGAGNIAPAGSATPWKRDAQDGNGKTVSSYASDVAGRLQPATTTTTQTEPAARNTTQDMNDWEPVEQPAQPQKSSSMLGKVLLSGPTALLAARNAIKDIPEQMMEGGSDLVDLVTGNSDAGLDAQKAAFNAKYANGGKPTSAETKDMFLKAFQENPGGKGLGASRLFPPIAAGASLFKNVINPPLEEAANKAGLDPEDVPLAEIPLMALGGRTGAKSLAPDMVDSAVTKAGAAAKDVAGVPVSSTLPESLTKMDNGSPLLVSNSGATQGIRDFAKFTDTDGIDWAKTADKLETLQKTDPNATVLDAMTSGEGDLPTGTNIQGLVKSIAQSPGQGRTILAQLAARRADIPQEIQQNFKDNISGTPYSKVMADTAAQKAAAAPLYTSAYEANPSMASPEINRILDTKDGNAALKDSVRIMQNNRQTVGMSDPELVEQAKLAGSYEPGTGGIASGLKMETLDNVKKALDRQYASSGYSDNSILSLKNALTREMDRLDTTAKDGQPGQYAQARSTFAEPARIQEAYGNGGKFMTQRPEDIASYMNDKTVSAPEKASFASGAVDNVINRLKNNNLPLSRIDTDGFMEKLRPLFPDQKSADNFAQRLDITRNKDANNKNLFSNSATYQNAAFAQKPVQSLAGHIIRTAADPLASAGNILGGIADKALAKHSENMSADSKATIARILSSKDPNALRQLAAQRKAQ